MEKNINDQVTVYINEVSKGQKEIMETIRKLIHLKVENVKEEFKWNRPIFRTTKDFAYLQANKNYITLGLTKNIDKLRDPDGLLEGTGKTMRHIKIKK